MNPFTIQNIYRIYFFLQVTVHFARNRNFLFPRSIILLNSFSFFPCCLCFISFAYFVLLKNFSSIVFLSFSLSSFAPYLISCTLLIYINFSSHSLQICSLTDFSHYVLLFSVTIIFLILVVFVDLTMHFFSRFQAFHSVWPFMIPLVSCLSSSQMW